MLQLVLWAPEVKNHSADMLLLAFQSKLTTDPVSVNTKTYNKWRYSGASGASSRVKLNVVTLSRSSPVMETEGPHYMVRSVSLTECYTKWGSSLPGLADACIIHLCGRRPRSQHIEACGAQLHHFSASNSHQSTAGQEHWACMRRCCLAADPANPEPLASSCLFSVYFQSCNACLCLGVTCPI